MRRERQIEAEGAADAVGDAPIAEALAEHRKPNVPLTEQAGAGLRVDRGSAEKKAAESDDGEERGTKVHGRKDELLNSSSFAGFAPSRPRFQQAVYMQRDKFSDAN